MEKYALITGASRGIGHAFAHLFAANGYSLLLVARTASELAALQTELTAKFPVQVKILALDLSQRGSVETLMAHFQEEMSELEVLINNAGFGWLGPFHEMPMEDLNGMLAVNVQVLTQLTFFVLPFMLAKKRGYILNVSSVAAYLPGPYMTMYFATKAYVSSFSEALYEEYQEQGVTISVLCPGATQTSFFTRAHVESSKMHQSLKPMSSEEVAEIAYKGLMQKKRVIIAGWKNKLNVLQIKFTPNWLLLKVIKSYQKPKTK